MCLQLINWTFGIVVSWFEKSLAPCYETVRGQAEDFWKKKMEFKLQQLMPIPIFK